MKRTVLCLGILALLLGLLQSGFCSTILGSEETGPIATEKLEKEAKPSPPPAPERIPRIDPQLDLATDEPLEIIVYLADQPHHEISQEIKGRYQPELDWLSSQIYEINRRYAIQAPSPVDPQFRALSSSDMAARDRLNGQIKELIIEMRREFGEEVERRTGYQQENLRRYIESLGGWVGYGYTIVNAVAARVPGVRIGQLASHPSVGYIVKDQLMEGHLDVSTRAIYANTFWDAGYTGYFSYGGVIDSGIDSGHPSLSYHTHRGRVFHNMAQGSAAYNDNPNTTDDLQGHGTHVGGIVWSRGNVEWLLWDWSNHKGVAYGTYYKCINGKAGWRTTSGGGAMYWSDGMKAIDWAANTEWADAINLSYGGATSQDETSMSRFFDALWDDEWVPSTISAGNDGPGSYTLGDPSISYNAFCVAAMDDRNTSGRSDDVIASFSSRGPTALGRKKPDVATPGHRIASCYNKWEGAPFLGNPDFVDMSGTSMAAPHLMGAILLYKQAVGWYIDPNIIKAVFINTADDWGSSGWDNAYGWGYLNLDRTWNHRTDYFTGSVKPSGQPGDYKLYRGTMYNGDKATLAWNRHAIYNGSNYPSQYWPLNDIDLKLYSHSNGSVLDWSTAVRDNVEQVRATATHDVVVKVEAYSSSFHHVSSEPYALATEESFSAVSPPALTVTVDNPGTVLQHEVFTVTVPVRNTGGCTAFSTQVRLTLPSGFTIVSGANPQNVGHITAGGTGTGTWTVKAPWTPGPYTLAADARSDSYGEHYTGSDTSPISVLTSLGIVESSLSGSFTPPDPWSQPGLIELTFHVFAREDLTHITFSSDDLHHETLDKKLAGYTINFVPQEIGFLPEGETEAVTAYVQIPIGQQEGLYSGYFRAVACNGASAAVLVEITVHPLSDMDVEDNRANLKANTMELVGIPGGLVLGTFHLINPNMMENNVDLYDGPGNVGLADITYSSTSLWNKTGSAWIPADSVIFTAPDLLASGDAERCFAVVIIPHPIPLDTYYGTVTATDGVAGVSDQFTLKVSLVGNGLGGDLTGGFWAVPEEGANELYWTSFELGEEGYNLYRNQEGTSSFRKLNGSLMGGTGYSDQDVLPGVVYEYKLGLPLPDGREILLGPISVQALGRLPTSYALLQNCPNPCEGKTQIRYALPNSARVALKIFNVAGQVVRTLVDELQAPGYHSVSWDGRDGSGMRVTPGVYFYRLDARIGQAEDFHSTKKMVVVR